MRDFVALYQALDAATGSAHKIEHLRGYLCTATAADGAWAVHVLSGGKRKRAIASARLRRLAAALSGLPDWLVEESYAHVGDLAETVTLLAATRPPTRATDDASLAGWIERVDTLAALDESAAIDTVLRWFDQLPDAARFVLLKLMTGALRVGVSQGLVIKALAAAFDLAPDLIAERLSGGWQPDPAHWQLLIAPATEVDQRAARALPFFLASPLETDPAELPGRREDWLAEWKWDGIRAQLIRGADKVRLWSRGDESLDGRFPEVEHAAHDLPAEVVLDGEILGWRDDRPLPFTQLQKRINRLRPSAAAIAACPVRFIAYDLLRADNQDLRAQPLRERRLALAALVPSSASALMLSPALAGDSWQALHTLRGQARERGVEGLMLKQLDSPYRSGRRRGDWWKWKIDPLRIDAVLIYAQAGRGRRANLYTDYTFGLWQDGQLYPVAKAYSGLDDRDIARLDRWIRAHTIQRFGPVRQVEPLQVFELAFEAVNFSSRHKSGVAVRFPRIARWRQDKPAGEADALDALRQLADAKAGP